MKVRIHYREKLKENQYSAPCWAEVDVADLSTACVVMYCEMLKADNSDEDQSAKAY